MGADADAAQPAVHALDRPTLVVAAQRNFAREETQFHGFSEDKLYRRTLFLKCDHWRHHFGRRRGRSRNGDESVIRSLVIKQLQLNTPFTTRFTVDAALNHDLFYNV